ncbi:hypothetical protein L7F22_027611 [Adiantum nelumboides]|nr:hypothetical protein [Adiantum nelumboides]
MIPATSHDQDYFVMWSSIRDLKHQEEVDIQDACIRYHNRVRLFDERVGLQFFYVFVRLPYHAWHEQPWRQWTLVAEITAESGEELDKDILMERLDYSIRNKITKFTAWFRPDLIYVKPKRVGYQVRFENERESLMELRSTLMKSAGDPDEEDSYYGVFCRILGLDVNASHEDITAKYEASPLEIQLACLEHLLSNHPVKLLYPIPYLNRSLWTRKQSADEITMTNTSEASSQMDVEDNEEGSSNVVDDEEYSESDEAEDEDVEEDDDEDWDNLNENEIEARVRKGLPDLKDEEPAVLDVNDFSSDVADSDDEEFEGKRNVRLSYMLKAAVRPYTYVNFIREMVILRGALLEKKQQSRPNFTALK